LILLAFLTTTCEPCRQFWEMLADPGARAVLDVGVAVVTPSPAMEDERLAGQLTPPGVDLHMGSETWFAYGVLQAGTFVLVRDAPGGEPPFARQGEVIGRATPAGPTELLDLLNRWLGRPS
jgi:hypothetical protein